MFRALIQAHVKTSVNGQPNPIACVRSEQGLAATRMQNEYRGLQMDWAKHGVKIAHSDELDLNTPQTSGMTRAAAITHAKAGASKLWAGTMVVQPDQA
jgi:hypothetical protein